MSCTRPQFALITKKFMRYSYRGPEGPHGLHGRGRGEGYNDRRLHGVQLPRREAGSRPPDLHGARAREVQEGPQSGQGRVRRQVHRAESDIISSFISK